VGVDVRRAGSALHLDVAMTSYRTTRVRLEDLPGLTPVQRARREAWLTGR
jgi:hypothetical protein